MENIQLGIHHLSYETVSNKSTLYDSIYPDMYKNYYWSDDFSPEYYIAQAKAGFIAITDEYEEKELLLPEIQFTYALLDFKDLHISKKVAKLLRQKALKLEISSCLDEVAEGISKMHRNSWLTPRYLKMLKATQTKDDNFHIITAVIREEGEAVAGEIGYIIGRTYTSLSGFSSREKRYRNYGTAQLVLLAQHLKQHHFAFWNLGQSYMPYKLALGARIYERHSFLKRWYKESSLPRLTV
jgi:Leu/Phe-tRNA-protein transferase